MKTVIATGFDQIPCVFCNWTKKSNEKWTALKQVQPLWEAVSHTKDIWNSNSWDSISEGGLSLFMWLRVEESEILPPTSIDKSPESRLIYR